MENIENTVIETGENTPSTNINALSEVQSKGRAGRPKSVVSYPSEPFTIETLAEMNTLSTGNLRLKLKEAQKNGIVIALDEKQSNGGALGRKRTMYKFVPKTVENVQI